MEESRVNKGLFSLCEEQKGRVRAEQENPAGICDD